MKIIPFQNRQNAIPQKSKELTSAQILVLGFAAMILFGTFLLMLPAATANGRGASLMEAFFTSTSAVCVTGLVVVDTGTYFSLFGQLVILSLIQIGGLGFMSFATIFALFLGKKIMLRNRMLLQQAYNQTDLLGIVNLVRSVVLISFAVEALGTIPLFFRLQTIYPRGRALYLALFHSISAFNNAGFDLFGSYQSLTSFVSDPVINLSIMMLIIIGGLGFSVIAEPFTYRDHPVKFHSLLVLKMTGFLLLTGALGFFLIESFSESSFSQLPLPTRVLTAAFQSVTTRTAGFSTLDVASLSNGTLLFFIILMFIGASPGSTGGGVKTTTIAAIYFSLKSTIQGKDKVVIGHRTLPSEIIQKAYVVVVLSMIWIVAATLILSLTESKDFLPLLFEVFSAFCTVGLSTGLTPELTTIGKTTLIATMFFGRLGPLTVAFALAQKRKGSSLVGYPEEQIMIG